MTHLTAVLNFASTHVLGIVLSLVATYVIGFIWHGPLFGKQWIALNKLTPPKKDEMKFSMMLPGLTANLVLVVVQASVLGRAFELVSMTSVLDALIIATIIWLPFTALVIININTWCGKPAKLTVLDCGHALASIWAIAAVMYYTL